MIRGDVVSCYSIFSCMRMFCRSLFVLLYIFFWSLCCLFFFDIRILITPLVSSNSSCYATAHIQTLKTHLIGCLVIWYYNVPTDPTNRKSSGGWYMERHRGDWRWCWERLSKSPLFLSSQQVLTRDIIVAANAHSIEILEYRMKKNVLQTCHLMVSTIIWHLNKFIWVKTVITK